MANRLYEQQHLVASIESITLCRYGSDPLCCIFDSGQIFWPSDATYDDAYCGLNEIEALDFQFCYPEYHRFYGERALFDQAVALYGVPLLHDVRNAIRLVQDQPLAFGK